MEKIEIGYRALNPGGSTPINHKYLLYTNSEGKQFTVAGWAEKNGGLINAQSGSGTNGDIITTDGPYLPGVPDWAPDGQHYREPIKTGSDLSSDWQRLLDAMKDIAREHHPYKFGTQNSNSTADEALVRTGLPKPPVYPYGSPHWAPGSEVPLWSESDSGDPFTGLPWPDAWPAGWARSPQDVATFFSTARTMAFKDPLVLDLDNDGIETIGVNIPSPVLFDHNADGVRKRHRLDQTR